MLDAPDAAVGAKGTTVLGNKNVPASISGGSKAGNKIASAAAKQLGLPYGWGKEQPGVTFDCSGLVQYAYSRAGIKLPRVSNQQANYGRKVALNQLRVGDLVAWDNSSRNQGADHIAIYVGHGKIIEAAHTGTNVRTRKLGANEGAWGVQILR
jgi:cell wall-associated NlpC family hydrolase